VTSCNRAEQSNNFIFAHHCLMAIGRTFFLFVQGLQGGNFTYGPGYSAFWKSGNCVQAAIRHWFQSAILCLALISMPFEKNHFFILAYMSVVIS
jgi:hypothetical protein